MRCPLCEYPSTVVKDTRSVTKNQHVRRRRACPKCHYKFTTYEVITERDR